MAIKSKLLPVIFLSSLPFTVSVSQEKNDCGVTISSDITDNNQKGCILYNVWQVINRISPEDGADTRKGTSVNLIRMLGGIKKSGKPYYDYDVCKYNNTTKNYSYDFSPLFERLDKIVYSDTPIHQIVMDQPDWAFQTGYTFIEDGTCDSIHFRKSEQSSIYGNSLPPFDYQAYSEYIKEVMKQLVGRYGKDKVLSWRFRIGTEIETPDHWHGSKQEFINHFINVAKAIKSVLPEAKVGPHTRNYDFVYRDKSFRNYKGEQVKSFAKDLLEQCAKEGIKCDFWGISDYVMTPNLASRNIHSKYNSFFAPFINDPNWNTGTQIDIMEYAPIVTMIAPDKKGYITCQTSHSDVIDICFAHQFYKHHDKGLGYIYQWGNRSNSQEADYQKMMNSMNNKQSYNVSVSGSPSVEGNIIDAIVAKDKNGIDVLSYNYNHKSYEYGEDQKVTLCLKTDLPVGKSLKYKIFSYSKENNKLNMFLEKYKDKYVKKGFDKMGDPKRCLTEEGLEIYNKMDNPKPFDIDKTVKTKTMADDTNKNKSVIYITYSLPSFSYNKIEIRY